MARHYHHYRVLVLKVLLMSIVIHVCVGSACHLAGQALGVNTIALNSVLIVVPLGLLVTAIPVMPAGVGTGHAAFSYLFRLLGSDSGADIFTLYALNMVLLGSIGGIIYLKFKSKEGGVEKESA